MKANPSPKPDPQSKSQPKSQSKSQSKSQPKAQAKPLPKPKTSWQKGQLIYVKAPPYYEKEYPYEISGAGDKMIRANLQHSPKVKKTWSHEEFELLIEMGMVRVVEDKAPAPATDAAQNPAKNATKNATKDADSE